MKKSYIIIGSLGIILFVIAGISGDYILSNISGVLILVGLILFIRSLNRGEGALAKRFSLSNTVYISVIALAIIISLGIYFFYRP